MKKPSSQDILFLSLTVILFIVLIIVVLFLIKGTNKRDTMFLENEAENIASDFFEIYRTNNDIESVMSQYGVVSFGIYLSNGQPVRLYGEAPRSLERIKFKRDISRSITYFNTERKTFVIIRQSGMRGMFSPGNPGMAAMQRRMGSPYMFLIEIKAGRYATRHLVYRYLTFIAPLIILILLGVFIYIYMRNVNYRERMIRQEQLARLGEVSRTLMHEIKNPLGAIRIQTGYLRRILPEERRRDIMIIEEETQRINNLIERIGEFLRDPIGKPERICIEEFVSELIKRFAVNINLINEDQSTHYVRFDRDRLRSTLENIIRNAIESYENEGQENIRVDIVVLRNRHNVIVKIVDYGKGIDEKNIKKIYDPFYTTKIKGSGIGLALVRRFVEAAGGEIRIGKNTKGGTEVTLVLKEAIE